MASFKKYNIDPNEYLEKARRRAKAHGYDPEKLFLSDNPVYKLNYNKINFGRHGYGDYLIYKILAKRGGPKYTAEYAEKKRNIFQNSHSQIAGKWKSNPESPNMLALKINW